MCQEKRKQVLVNIYGASGAIRRKSMDVSNLLVRLRKGV